MAACPRCALGSVKSYACFFSFFLLLSNKRSFYFLLFFFVFSFLLFLLVDVYAMTLHDSNDNDAKP